MAYCCFHTLIAVQGLMFKKVIFLGIIISFSFVIGSQSTDEEFLFFKNSGLASIGPCRTMDPVENQIRRKAANTILEIYDVVNRKGSFPQNYILSGGFSHLKNQEGDFGQEPLVIPNSWETLVISCLQCVSPKEGYLLSACVRDIKHYAGRLVIECSSASELAEFSVLSDFYSDDQISYIKSDLTAARPDFLSADLNKKLKIISSYYLYGDCISTSDLSGVELGDYLYIPGHQDYKKKYFLGYSCGENLYCVGFKGRNFMLMGFGSFFADGPKTAEQIQQCLAEAYVSPGKDLEYKEALEKIKEQPFSHGKILCHYIKTALQL